MNRSLACTSSILSSSSNIKFQQVSPSTEPGHPLIAHFDIFVSPIEMLTRLLSKELRRTSKTFLGPSTSILATLRATRRCQRHRKCRRATSQCTSLRRQKPLAATPRPRPPSTCPENKSELPIGVPSWRQCRVRRILRNFSKSFPYREEAYRILNPSRPCPHPSEGLVILLPDCRKDVPLKTTH